MSLDACVYCDCFERGLLRSLPPEGCTLMIWEDGDLQFANDNLALEVEIAFDRWKYFEACEHQNFTLIHHRIGNIATVGLLRSELSQYPDKFPIILSQVIYDGSHGGDFIPVATMPQLAVEVEALATIHCPPRTKPAWKWFTQSSELEDREWFIRNFETQMRELVAASLQVGKPIAF